MHNKRNQHFSGQETLSTIKSSTQRCFALLKKVDYSAVAESVIGGETIGNIVGASGALLTGSPVIETASLLGNGFGFFLATNNAFGFSNPTFLNLNWLNTGSYQFDVMSCLAIFLLLSGAVTYPTFYSLNLLMNTQNISFSYQDFMRNIAVGIPIFCMLIEFTCHFLDYFFKTREAPANSEQPAPRPSF